MKDSIDLIARKVIMSSLLYYGLDEPLIPDRQFDEWCVALAGRWKELDPFRAWQLGSAEEIRSSGFHVKITQAAVGGTVAWLKSFGVKKIIVPNKKWKWSAKHQVSWLTTADFAWGSAKEPKKIIVASEELDFI